MKIAYADDRQKGPGHGLLIFSEAIVPDAPWRIAIQRGSDHNYLSGSKRDQWVGETIFIPLEGKVDASGNLAISLPPEVVDSLSQQEQYQVYLKNDGPEPLRGRLKVDAITYSPAETRDNTAKIVPEEKSAPKPAPVPPPAVETGAEKVAEEALPESIPVPPAPPPAEPKSRLWRYILLALLILACVAWFIIDPGRPDEDSKKEAGTVKIEEPKSEKAAQSGKEPGQSGTTQGQLSADERVGGFFAAANATPQAAFDLSQRLPRTTPADQDAIYRLYYYAAENDVPAALMPFALCIDPSAAKWGTIQKDAPLAWSVYERAKSVDPEAARAAQQKLLEWLRTQAKNGDAQAAKWLLEIGK